MSQRLTKTGITDYVDPFGIVAGITILETYLVFQCFAETGTLTSRLTIETQKDAPAKSNNKDKKKIIKKTQKLNRFAKYRPFHQILLTCCKANWRIGMTTIRLLSKIPAQDGTNW